MFDKMLVITAGVNEAERTRVVKAFGPCDPPLVLHPLSQDAMDSTVEEVVRAALEDRGEEGSGASAPWPLAFLAAFPRSRIEDFIAAFRTSVPGRAVYASLTPTNGEWTWRYLVEHLDEEHKMMMEMEKSRGDG